MKFNCKQLILCVFNVVPSTWEQLLLYAEVAKLVDALASGASGG